MANLYSRQQYDKRTSSCEAPDATAKKPGIFIFAWPTVDVRFG